MASLDLSPWEKTAIFRCLHLLTNTFSKAENEDLLKKYASNVQY